jgi:hypothetical protein
VERTAFCHYGTDLFPDPFTIHFTSRNKLSGKSKLARDTKHDHFLGCSVFPRPKTLPCFGREVSKSHHSVRSEKVRSASQTKNPEKKKKKKEKKLNKKKKNRTKTHTAQLVPKIENPKTPIPVKKWYGFHLPDPVWGIWSKLSALVSKGSFWGQR